MAEQRLPIVNSDDGVWGDILRQYLSKEHFNDDTDNPLNGQHQKVTIKAGLSSAGGAPLKFASGTLLSTAEAGAVEYNTDTLYFTIATGTVRKKVALYDDSSGATGDLYYRDSSGALTRLGVVSNGKTLRTVSGVPAWSDAILATASKTADYTIAGTDVVIFADGTSNNVTITLPTASAFTGYRFYVKRIDNAAHTVSIARSGSDTIDGGTSVSLDLQYTSLTLISNGSAWYII